MSPGLPKGEKLRRAVRWVSDRRREAPDGSLAPILSEAALRFDLTPQESEFLLEFFRQGGDADAEG